MLFNKQVQSNIASKDKKKKWHPCLIKMGNVVDTQMIGETIAERSSLTAGDVHNVIRNLMAVMREQLLNSRTVKLEGLGTFTMVCQSRARGWMRKPMLVRHKSRDCVASLPGIYAGCRRKYHPCADSGSVIYPRQPVDESTGSGRRWQHRRFGDDKPGGGGQEAPDPAA